MMKNNLISRKIYPLIDRHYFLFFLFYMNHKRDSYFIAEWNPAAFKLSVILNLCQNLYFETGYVVAFKSSSVCTG